MTKYAVPFGSDLTFPVKYMGKDKAGNPIECTIQNPTILSSNEDVAKLSFTAPDAKVVLLSSGAVGLGTGTIDGDADPSDERKVDITITFDFEVIAPPPPQADHIELGDGTVQDKPAPAPAADVAA